MIDGLREYSGRSLAGRRLGTNGKVIHSLPKRQPKDPAAGHLDPFGGFGVNTLRRGPGYQGVHRRKDTARWDPSEQNRVPDRFAALIKRLPPPRGKSIGTVGVRTARIEIELDADPSQGGIEFARAEIQVTQDNAAHNEGLVFDRSAAERFLAIIGRGETRFTFQIFDDNRQRRDAHAAANARRKKEGKKKLPSPFVRVLHGSLDQHFTELVRLNDMGAGIFVSVNATNLRGRTAKDIVEVRWLFIDLDGNPLPTEGPRPHLVVETSPGHWHVYWKVDGVGLDEFKAKQMALLARHGGDKVINYLNCVLRVPGFLHRKQEPRLIRIVEINDDIPPYRADDFPSATEEPRHRGNGDANGGDRVEFPADRAGGEIDIDTSARMGHGRDAKPDAR